MESGDLKRYESNELCKKAIEELIKNHVANDKSRIKSKRAIYQELVKSGKNYGLAESTIYRFLREMNVEAVGAGRYDIVPNKSVCLNNIIQQRKCNRTIVFNIVKPSYGQLISKILNSHYSGKEDIFHCIAVQDTLICFYYYKKGDKNRMSREKIIKDIKEILSEYSLQLPW